MQPGGFVRQARARAGEIREIARRQRIRRRAAIQPEQNVFESVKSLERSIEHVNAGAIQWCPARQQRVNAGYVYRPRIHRRIVAARDQGAKCEPFIPLVLHPRGAPCVLRCLQCN